MTQPPPTDGISPDSDRGRSQGATSWIRRHPVAATILGVIGSLFILMASTSEDPRAAFLGLAVLYALIFGVVQVVTRRRDKAKAPLAQLADRERSDDSRGTTSGPDQAQTVPPSAMAVPAVKPLVPPDLGDLLMLTPAQFEDLTARVLAAIGYRDVNVVGGAGDLTADIICRDRQGRSTVVQCKRYAPGTNIGTPVIQTFIGMMAVHHRADRGIVVTTVPLTQLTKPAIDLARRHGIALIDGPSLCLLVHLTGVPVVLPPPRTHIYCRQCGTQNPVSDRFCSACGSPLGRTMQTTTAPQGPDDNHGVH